MFRPDKMENELTVKIAKTNESEIYALLKSGDIELVNQKGVMVAWCNSETSENKFLEYAKADKVVIRKNFPKRYFDDGNKPVEITKENLKDCDLTKAVSEIPKKYKPDLKEV